MSRLLYLHRTQGQGVEGVHIHGMCAGFRARGYDVGLVGPADEKTVSQGSRANHSTSLARRMQRWVSEYAPEAAFEFAEMAYNIPARKALQAALMGGKPEFIYERYAIFATAGSRMARELDVPHVLEINYTAQTPLLRKRSALLKPWAIAKDRRIFRDAAVLVAVSSYLRDHLIRDYGIPAERVVMTPNAADPQRFDPQVAPITAVHGQSLEGRFVIGFVGTFAPWHGLDLLCDAFERIATIHPQACLVLVGNGPQRDAIAARAARSGLQSRVLFTGDVPNVQLAPYVARFDAAVLPDTNEYGSPMKLFEYLAMGRPVVAPDYGPVRDVVENRENGLIFARRDPGSLAAALGALLDNPALRQNLGLAGRRTILERRTWLHNVDIVLEAVRRQASRRN
jgi:glycosyltransferase involved in cell wall biosynthesis